MATKEEIKSRVDALSFDNVITVYSGKSGGCCCGCRGIHRHSTKFPDTDVFPHTTFNDKHVKKVIDIIKMYIDVPLVVYDLGPDFVALDLGDKQYIAYTG